MRSIITILFAALTVSTTAMAGGGTSGTAIGVLFGHPGNVGLSVRLNAINVGVALQSNGSYIRTTLDHWTVCSKLGSDLNWFLGPGIDLGIGDPFLVAVRLPIGLQWMPAKQLEVFGQFAPGLQLINSVDFYWAGTVGVRYVL